MTTEMTNALSTDPEHIAVSKSRGIDIDWKDGHHSSYGLEYLRNRAARQNDRSEGGRSERQPVPDVQAKNEDGERRAGGIIRDANPVERWA
jgi:hypothetical protein